MAVTRDATGVGGVSGASGTGNACTVSHTIGTAGPSTVVFAFVAISVATNSTGTTCSTTYGGTAMTQLGLTLLGSGTSRSAYGIYYLRNPPSGAQNCVATTAGASTKTQVVVSTVSYTGVGEVGVIQSNATLTISATSVANGYNIFGHINGTALSTPSQSQRYTGGSTFVTGVGDILLVQDAAGTGSNITFSVAGTATTPSTFGVALAPYVPGVQFDAVGASSLATSSPISWTHTASGTDRAVLVAVWWRGTAGISLAAPTYDGVAMTQLATIDINPSIPGTDLMWYYGMLDPPTGAKTVSVTATGTTTEMRGASASYSSVDSFGTAVTNVGLGTTPSISATAAVGDRIAQVFCPAFSNVVLTAYNQSQRYNSMMVLGDAAGTGSSVTFNATMTSNRWAAVAVPLIQVSAGTPVAAALSGSGTLTATATPEYDRTADLTGSGTLTATISQICPLTPGLTGSGTLTATANKVVETFPVAAALSGSGTLSATTTPAFAASAASSGSGTLSATATARYTRTATLSGSGTLSATVSQIYAPPAALTGSGTLSATATAVSAGEATPALTGSGTLSATATRQHPMSAALTGTGALTGTVGPSHAPNLTASGTLTATVTAQYTRAASPSGSGTLNATVTAQYARTANPSGAGTLSASVVPVVPLSATLSGVGTLNATVVEAGTSLALLSGTGSLTATTLAKPAIPASLTGAGTLSAVMATTGAAPAPMAGTGALSATLQQIYPVASALDGSGALTVTVLKVVPSTAVIASPEILNVYVGTTPARIYLGDTLLL